MQKGNPTIITGIIILLIILATAAFVTRRAEAPIDDTENETASTTPAIDTATSTPANTSMLNENPDTTENAVTIVTYTKDGFSPKEITINAGDTVRFENESGPNMWVASAFHPTHTTYSDTSLNEHCPDTDNTTFDACTNYEAGTNWDFTFTKTGEWGYHNHSRANHFGKVIVQ
jgi:plastocyanin